MKSQLMKDIHKFLMLDRVKGFFHLCLWSKQDMEMSLLL